MIQVCDYFLQVDHIKQGKIPYVPVIFMVSGGADSIALLMYALNEKLDLADGAGSVHIEKQRIHVLHVNHLLRGADAHLDEQYTKDLCSKFGIPIRIVRAQVEEISKHSDIHNVENTGREIRYSSAYAFAQDLAQLYRCRVQDISIATAHTANDRAETFIMNSLRGAGSKGLSSLHKRSGQIVRPLLEMEHEQLEQYLINHNITWRIDSTNKDTTYMRSFVRYKVLPVLKQKNNQVVSALSRTSELLEQDSKYLERLSQQAYDEICVRSNERMVMLDLEQLMQIDDCIVRRVLQKACWYLCPDIRLEYKHIQSMCDCIYNSEKSCTIVGNVDVRTIFGNLVLQKSQEHKVPSDLMLTCPGQATWGDIGIIRAEYIEKPADRDVMEWVKTTGIQSQTMQVILDADKVLQYIQPHQSKHVFVLGAPRQQERMCPLGMHGRTKAISDVLRDAKVVPSDRHHVCVVRHIPSGNVVYVAGIRADERFCCTKMSRRFIQLSFQLM